MNRWARMLSQMPASAQRLIARSQRVSLPRGCSADERLTRLRLALCHAATVRVTYALLDVTTQSALQDLRSRRGGIAPAELEQRYGALRSWRQLTADPRPQTISERLLLLGWLMLRPATPHRSMRYLVPPEVRRWLPTPLALASLGPAPAPAPAPAARAAHTILLSCAEHPLHLRADGTPRRAEQRLLAERLAPLPLDEAAALVCFLLPLLADLGLVSSQAGTYVLAPAGQRFLGLPATTRLERLQHAWLAAARPDPWLRPQRHSDAGIDWPVLRQRLCEWVAALPLDQLLAPSTLYTALAAALGPLSDAQTHGFRTVDRAPWQPRRAAALFEAALRGPLRWFGLVAWSDDRRLTTDHRPMTNDQRPTTDDRPTTTDERRRTKDEDSTFSVQRSSLVFRPSSTIPTVSDEACSADMWRYGEPGEVLVPHTSIDASLLRLLPYARWQSVDSQQIGFVLTRRSITHALNQGWSEAALWTLLERWAGPVPAAWRDTLDTPRPAIQLISSAVVLTTTPAVLERASQARSVRRAIASRVAPGIALVEPEQVAALTRALERQDITCQEASPSLSDVPVSDLPTNKIAPPPACAAPVRRPRQPEPPVVHPGDWAALLVACHFYREHAPPDAPLLPHEDLEQRLYRALPPALRTATAAVLADLHPRPALQSAAAPDHAPPVVETVAQLRTTLERQQPISITYNTAERGAWTRRVVRPLALEQRGETWYLRAYCTARAEERTFRVDRIGSIAPVKSET